MALIPIEHAETISSTAEAVALFRALKDKRVGFRGLETEDPIVLRALALAADDGHMSTVRFSDGVIDDATLCALAVAEFGYLDIRTSSSSLRLWPGRISWVTGGGQPERKTPDAQQAAQWFLSDPQRHIRRGHVSAVKKAARPALSEFLVAARARVSVSISVAPDVARDLTDLAPGTPVGWAGDGVKVEFPSGKIHSSLRSSENSDRNRSRWHARVDKALRKAR